MKNGEWKYVNESDHEWMMDMRVNEGEYKYKKINMRRREGDKESEYKYVSMRMYVNINVNMWGNVNVNIKEYERGEWVYEEWVYEYMWEGWMRVIMSECEWRVEGGYIYVWICECEYKGDIWMREESESIKNEWMNESVKNVRRVWGNIKDVNINEWDI